jgi:hypothetical protein
MLPRVVAMHGPELEREAPVGRQLPELPGPKNHPRDVPPATERAYGGSNRLPSNIVPCRCASNPLPLVSIPPFFSLFLV